MPQEKTIINCPNCGHEVDVNDILYHQLNEKISSEYNSKLVEQEREFQKKYSDINKEKQEIEKQKIEISETIERGVKMKMNSEKTLLEKKIREEIAEEKSGEISSYKDQIAQKIEETKDLNKTKAELERVKREKDELKSQIEAESEKIYSKKLSEEREKIKKDVEEKNQLKVSEKEHIIEQLKDQLKEAQRKAEQGSTQIQGEIQELAIEDWLKNNFPLDSISEIKKGARGADCIQVINTYTKQNCGAIYYESKRTKDFQPSWIEKFKTDMRSRGAEFGVLVTEVMPKDMKRLGQKDVFGFAHLKNLRVYVLLLENQ